MNPLVRCRCIAVKPDMPNCRCVNETRSSQGLCPLCLAHRADKTKRGDTSWVLATADRGGKS